MDTQQVFQLRKDAKNYSGQEKLDLLLEAYEIGSELYRLDQYDKWTQLAFAWTLIDLIKYYLSIADKTTAVNHYNKLNSIVFEETEELINSQKETLKMRIDPMFASVNEANNLSKSGDHLKSIALFRQLFANGNLATDHHEYYGWAIYRYLKAGMDSLSSLEVRTALRDYMILENDRPSLLHSMILNFAVNYGRDNHDFNLLKFFQLWKPSNLRDDDKEISYLDDGAKIPSLVSRLMRMLVDRGDDIDVLYLLDSISLGYDNDAGSTSSQRQVLSLLREAYFWKLINVKKDNNFPYLFELFEHYSNNYCLAIGEKWHSEILSLACRYMSDDDEWRFIGFFVDWNPSTLRDEDWKDQVTEEATYKPLAIQCIKKAYKIIKADDYQQNTTWLMSVYKVAIDKNPLDEWLIRELAILMIHAGEIEEAIALYQQLVLMLGDKYYVWGEFAQCFKTNMDLHIGMLAKALILERNEDYIGPLRLTLAEALITAGKYEHAAIELAKYRAHREEMDRQLPDEYQELNNQVADTEVTDKDNDKLYAQYATIANDYAYQSIEWTEMILIDSFKNDRGKLKLKFSNGKKVEFLISRHLFKEIDKIRHGIVYRFKLYEEVVEIENPNNRGLYRRLRPTKKKVTFKPLICQSSDMPDWGALDDGYAVIDYLNEKKGVIHAITSDHKTVYIRTDLSNYKVGNLIKGKRLTVKRRDELVTELKDIKVIDKAEGLEYFDHALAIVDHVNTNKNLFHYSANHKVQGVVKFNEVDFRPAPGDGLAIVYVLRKNEQNNKIYCTEIDIQPSDEDLGKLVQHFSGELCLKYKVGGATYDYDDPSLNDYRRESPDFAFVNDYYIPRKLLRSKGISYDCYVTGKAVNVDGEYRVIHIEVVTESQSSSNDVS